MKIWRVPYPKFGDGVGLERVRRIAAELGVDLAAFGATGAAITGSNGKGSTAAMLASILCETGEIVGRFTSPHLFRLNERFCINGEDISDAELATHWDRVAGAAERAGESANLGGFEFLFLIAADWFKARGCACTVWEAGIGGRCDPVRLIEAQRAALVSLDLEHTELLGKTLEDIAYDKLDAAPAGARVFVGESCAPLRDKIEAHCAQRGTSPVFVPTLKPSPLAGEGREGIGAIVEGGVDTLTPGPSPQGGEELSLSGAHQRENAALAIALARDMRPRIADEQVAHGLARTRWPGRLEIIDADPLVVIDVGHTPAAIRAALNGFMRMRGDREGVLVCGCSADKNAEEIVAALAPAFATIICAQPRHKGRPAAEIAAIAAAHGGAEVVIAESMADARALALAKARAKNAAVYVAGGLFLAIEFKAVSQGLDPARLAFF